MASLGIKIGSDICAAATIRADKQRSVNAIRRQSVLFWNPGEAPELRTVGAVPASQAEIEAIGFVDRVGDPVDVVASDGSAHRAENLLASAVAYLSRYMEGAFDESPTVSVSHPSHWDAHVVSAFEQSLADTDLSSARLVPEAAAIAARASAMRGIQPEGTYAVYDLGGNGVSVSLIEMGAHDHAGRTLRSTEFGAAQVDYSLFRHVLELVEDDIGGLNYDDPAVVRDLALLRDRCRVAKETLSTETATEIDVEIAGFCDSVRLVRPELEEMLREPIEQSMDLVREVLHVSDVDGRALSGIVLAGGGGSIPVVTEILSSEFGVPILRDRDPGLTAALGAATLPEAEAPKPVVLQQTVDSPPEESGDTDITSQAAAPRTGEFPVPPPLPARSAPSRTAEEKRGVAARLSPIVIAATAAIVAIAIAAVFFAGRIPENTSIETPITPTVQPVQVLPPSGAPAVRATLTTQVRAPAPSVAPAPAAVPAVRPAPVVTSQPAPVEAAKPIPVVVPRPVVAPKPEPVEVPKPEVAEVPKPEVAEVPKPEVAEVPRPKNSGLCVDGTQPPCTPPGTGTCPESTRGTGNCFPVESKPGLVGTDEVTDDTVDDEVTDDTVDDEVTDDTVDDEVTDDRYFTELPGDPFATEEADDPVVEDAQDDPVVDEGPDDPVGPRLVEKVPASGVCGNGPTGQACSGETTP